MTRLLASAVFLASLSFGAVSARALDAQQINDAQFGGVESLAQTGVAEGKATGPDALVVKTQALLGRRSISPGVIDGFDGENYRKAIAQFRRQEGLGQGEHLDEDVWRALGRAGADQIVREYTISEKDAAYEFADEIPADYAKQAKMKRLAFTSPVEMYAERFHMSEGLLRAMNPKAAFKAGETLLIVSIKRETRKGAASIIEANKTTGMVVVYADDQRILASYPATIGSETTPSPEGEHTITRIAKNPAYYYDPAKNFQQGKNVDKLTLPPGPNNPVGSVWIALSKPTYGIHGTPEPSKVSKTSSHGCIRLTNWDAEELADMVQPGVIVRFTN
ncbi:MAG: L,D-transpeptidase [Beijerinckiaceae bacterium]|nr:L,D-transpeptidase [Beijerinckiaceae bacterium]